MTSSRWAAVVVNHDAGPLLLRCVRSLLETGEVDGPPAVVVVDNASTDHSLDALADRDDVQVVAAPGNVGYARAANLGIAATRAPIVAVLNPDTELLEGTAAAMVDALERDPGVAAVGPRVLDPDGSVYPSARRVPGLVDAVGHGLLGFVCPRNRFTRRYRELDADPGRPRDVDWVSGAAVWLRRDALDGVGGWDEGYFMYMEDVDLCSRLRERGHRVRYEPAGTVVHVQGASTGRRPYRMIVEHHRSLWRYARRRFTGVRSPALPFAAVYLALRLGLALVAHGWQRPRPGRTSATGAATPSG